MDQDWMNKEAQKKLHKRELDSWLEFMKWNRHTVVKVLTIHQQYLARQGPPFITTAFQAMWMSCIVFAVMMAFGPAFGMFIAMTMGCCLAALTNKAMLGLGGLLYDRLEKITEKKKEEIKDGDTGDSDR